MEGRKQSSSSFTSDLFGSKESSASSSSGIFGSIFAPSPKVFGQESLRPEAVEKKQEPASQKVYLRSVKVIMLALQTRRRAHFIRKKRCNHVISARQYTMGVKMCILTLRIPRALATLLSIKMEGKMTQALLQEETGGRGPCTTRRSPSRDCQFIIYTQARMQEVISCVLPVSPFCNMGNRWIENFS